MDNRCVNIVRDKGVSWLFTKNSIKPETLDVISGIGDRDVGVQSINCYNQIDDLTFITIPNSDYFNELGGTFSGGMLLSMPEAANNGDIHTLLCKEGDFQLYELDGDLFFRTSGEHEVYTSGKDLCDGNTYFVVFYRDARYSDIKLGIKIYNWDEFVETVPDSSFTSTKDLYIGIDSNDLLNDRMYEGTKIHGLFFAVGQNVAEQKLMDEYWFLGNIPDNTVIYQLDEVKGDIIFESSGLKQHGYIDNYDDACWSTIQRGFSWQNRYGYSTGSFAIATGYTQLEIGGFTFDIDPACLIPFEYANRYKDVVTNSIEFEGRVRLNAKIVDMLCYEANGVTYGMVRNAERITFEPGVDELGFFAILDTAEEYEGYLYSLGDRFSVSFNALESTITVTVGGNSATYSITDAFHKIIVNVDDTNAYVYDGSTELGNFPIGTTFTGDVNNLLFADINAGSVLTGSNVALVGVRDSIISLGELAHFVVDNTIPELNNNSIAYFPCSKYEVIFDISGNSSHVDLFFYDDLVWSGKQSVLAYLLDGYSLVGTDRNDVNKIVIPYDVQGRTISYNVYDGQFVDKFKQSAGVPLFDCYIDMNPTKIENGFWSYFWNKDNSDVWGDLKSEYINVNDSNRFHSSELVQINLEYSLNSDYYRYTYSKTTVSKKGISIELADLVLLNFGNDINYVPLNIL